MLIEQFTFTTERGTKKQALKLSCEVCLRVFVRTFNVAKQRNFKRHYCSGTCHSTAMKRDGIADINRRETCQRLHGADYKISRPDVASKAGKAAHSPDIEKRRWKKIHDSWSKTSKSLSRGLTLPRSQGEIEFFNALSARFNVSFECPKYVNRWFIDGWCKDHDVYVQYDGVYWHQNPHAIKRDQRQDEWFAEKQMKLLRVTDYEWARDSESCLARFGSLLIV